MLLYVVRHGEAVDEAPGLGDTGRWLTGKGRKTTRRVARWLADKSERAPAAVWSSPLVRAVQTAEILAEYAALTDAVTVVPELVPAHDPRSVLERLRSFEGKGPLVLVGHEPGLSAVATALLGEIGWPGFKKSAVLAVSWKGEAPATFRFFLNAPKELGVVSDLAALR